MLLAAVASLVLFYLVPFFGIAPKLNLFLFLVALAVLMWGIRYLYNIVIAGSAKKRLLFIGAGTESLDLARLVVDNPQLGYRVSALVRLGQEELAPDDITGPWEVLDERSDLVAFITEHHVDIAVVSPEAYGNADLIGMLYSARGLQMDFVSLATFSERLTGRVPLGAISQQWFLENISENSKRAYEAAKRATDIAVASVLGVVALVLTPFIIAAIWLDSHGYPFIHQRRTGLHGKPFTLLKFRSMIPDAEKKTGAVWAGTNDPRVTRIGGFLRKTRLDELPQLLNVLRGDISLVGPRAERPEFDAQLASSIPFYFERYFIKPGLSGWAQINYPYGASPADALEKLQYDLFYIKNLSMALDVYIILETIKTVLVRRGS
jgi:exopolysaccharide biosynthesis polyprenyl glycosylphosphotransferase